MLIAIDCRLMTTEESRPPLTASDGCPSYFFAQAVADSLIALIAC